MQISIEGIKQQAKAYRKANPHIKHAGALRAVSRQYGFNSFEALKSKAATNRGFIYFDILKLTRGGTFPCVYVPSIMPIVTQNTDESFEDKKSLFFNVTGQPGSGKTTFLNMIIKECGIANDNTLLYGFDRGKLHKGYLPECNIFIQELKNSIEKNSKIQLIIVDEANFFHEDNKMFSELLDYLRRKNIGLVFVTFHKMIQSRFAITHVDLDKIKKEDWK